MMKSNRSILYKQKKVILTIVDGVLHLVCAVYLRYTLLKFYYTFKSFTLVQYLFSSNVYKTKSVHFDAGDNNCSYVGKICLYFVLMRGSRTFFGYGSTFIWGGQKERVIGGMGEKAKMRVLFFFCKIPIIQ